MNPTTPRIIWLYGLLVALLLALSVVTTLQGPIMDHGINYGDADVLNAVRNYDRFGLFGRSGFPTFDRPTRPEDGAARRLQTQDKPVR